MKSEKKGWKLIPERPLELMSRASFDTTAKHKGSVCFSNQRGKTRWEVYRTPPEHSNRGKGSRGLSDSVRHWHFLWAILLLLVQRMEPISWISVFLPLHFCCLWYKLSLQLFFLEVHIWLLCVFTKYLWDNSQAASAIKYTFLRKHQMSKHDIFMERGCCTYFSEYWHTPECFSIKTNLSSSLFQIGFWYLK